MKNRFRKVLSMLCIISMLVSGIPMVLAEELTEAPAVTEEVIAVTEEASAQAEPAAEAPAEEAAAEEAEAAPLEEPAVEEAPVEEAPVQETAEQEEASSEPAAEEPAAEETAEEPAAAETAEEPAAEEDDPESSVKDEEPAAEEPADEEPVAEEPADEEPADEEPVDEEPANEEPADEEPADEEQPADEEPTGEEPADEEPVDEEPADEEPADEEPIDEDPVDEEPADDSFDEIDDSEYEPETETSEDELVEFADGEWGYIDPEVVKQYVPEVTPELKYPESKELKVGKMVSDTIGAETGAILYIRSGSDQTIVLGLYANADVKVTINDRSAKFAPAQNPDPSVAGTYTEYELNAAAGETYTIALTAANDTPYTMTADAKDIEEKEEKIEENEEQTEVRNETEEAVEDTETEETEAVEETEEPTAGDESDADGTEEEPENNLMDETAEEMPAEQVINAWVTVAEAEYFIGGQVTLEANADIELDNAIVWQTRTADGEWQKAGYGMKLVIDVTEENANNFFRFRLADDTLSEELQISAAERIEVETEEGEQDPDAEKILEIEGEQNPDAEDILEIENEEIPLPELPEDRTVSFTVSWDDDETVHTFGDIAHLDAVLTGYDGFVYTLQWQQSADGENWTDIEGATENRLDVLVGEENYQLLWRVMVYTDLEATRLQMEAEGAQE